MAEKLYKMPSYRHSKVVSEVPQKVAVAYLYPGAQKVIISAQGNDALFELHEVSCFVDDHDWLMEAFDRASLKNMRNDQGHPDGIFIAEGRLRYGTGDEDDPPILDGDWEIRRPTQDEVDELLTGHFARLL